MEGVAAVVLGRLADGLGPVPIMEDIVLFAYGDQIARQAQAEVGETHGLHLGQKMVHDGVGVGLVQEAEGDGDAVDEGEGVIMELAVLAPPAGQQPGGRVEEGLFVSGPEPGGLGGVDFGVFRMAGGFGHVGEKEAGFVGQGVGVGVVMAEIDGVPPVGGAPVGRGPVAGVAGVRVLDQAVAVQVAGHHQPGPIEDPGVIRLGPDQVMGLKRIHAGGDQERGIGVQRIPGRFPGDKFAIARHGRIADEAVALGPGQVAVDGHADEVHGRESRRERRGGGGNQGVHIDRERDRVAGGVVGQHLHPRVDLEDVEEGAAEAVIARVGLDARESGVDSDGFQRIFDARMRRRRRRESDAHKRYFY